VPRKDEQGRLLTREGGLWTPEMGEHRIGWVANEGARISRVVRHVKRQRLPTDAQQRLRNSMFETAPVSPSHARRADESTLLSGSFGDAPSIGQDGSAVWTLPLRISVGLSQQMVSPTPSSITPILLPPSSDVEPAGDRPETPEGGEEFREAFAELEKAETRTYYDEEKDREDREAYYENLAESADDPEGFFEQLSDLLQRTHVKQFRYKPSKHVYPWVDLHEDLKLQSIYSGQEFEPEELIREDFRIDRERAARLKELLVAESVLGAERVAKELVALEASLPFNCEHVVPQSWYENGSPCAAISTTSLLASRSATASGAIPRTSTLRISRRSCANPAASARRIGSSPTWARGRWRGRRSTS